MKFHEKLNEFYEKLNEFHEKLNEFVPNLRTSMRFFMRSSHNKLIEVFDEIFDEVIDNNLQLNHSKSAEIVFIRPRAKVAAPDPIMGIPRVNSIKTLGVTLSNNFSMLEHVTKTINSCAQSLYALKMLRSRGLNNAAINIVFQAVVLSKLMYASPAWSGFAGKEEIGRINSFLNRCAKYSYAQPRMDFESLSSSADDKLFASIVSNYDHVLHRLLPPE